MPLLPPPPPPHPTPPHPLPIFYTCLKRRAVGNWKSVHIPPDSLRPGARTFCFTRVSPTPHPREAGECPDCTSKRALHCGSGEKHCETAPSVFISLGRLGGLSLGVQRAEINSDDWGWGREPAEGGRGGRRKDGAGRATGTPPWRRFPSSSAACTRAFMREAFSPVPSAGEVRLRQFLLMLACGAWCKGVVAVERSTRQSWLWSLWV